MVIPSNPPLMVNKIKTAKSSVCVCTHDFNVFEVGIVLHFIMQIDSAWHGIKTQIGIGPRRFSPYTKIPLSLAYAAAPAGALHKQPVAYQDKHLQGAG